MGNLCLLNSALDAVSYQLDWQKYENGKNIDFGAVADDGKQVINTSGEGLVDIQKVLSAFKKTPIVSFPGEVVQQQQQQQMQTIGVFLNALKTF